MIEAPYPPNTELVSAALLATFDGLTADQISTTLPKDTDSWKDEGFVTLAAYRAGVAQVDLPQRDGIVKVDAWATAGRSGGALAPWGKCWRLIELCRAGLEAESFAYGGRVTLPTDYAEAFVLSAYMLTEPEREPNDPSAFAHLTFDLAIHWAPVS